jgi:hypothetical protein
MPIDPRELARGALRPGAVVADSIPCRGCGYDLRGVPATGHCPECGRPVSSSNPLVYRSNAPRPCRSCGNPVVGLHPGDPCPHCGEVLQPGLVRTFGRTSLLDATKPYLRTMAVAGVFLLVGWVGMIVGLVIRGTMDWRNGALLLVAAGAAWWVGVFLITRPRPRIAGVDTDPATEWIVARLAARLTQTAWVIAGLADAAAAPAGAVGSGWIAAGPTVTGLDVVYYVALVVGSLGLVPLLVVLANLAYWAGESESSNSYRTMVWILPLTAMIAPYIYSSGMATIGRLLPTIMAPLVLVILAFDVVFVFVPQAWLGRTLLNVSRLAVWAMNNQVSAEQREQRLRERSERIAAMGALPITGVDPAEHPAFRLGGPEAPAPAAPAPPRRRFGGGGIRRRRPSPDPPPMNNAPFSG